ncbi:leucine zipper protein 2 isoform X6 [Rhinolophus sinicus]|uniref:leucine zipper protein 2 isoform X6 n=1 Tax=Rhinolophus sinicus TaxID=89399 RepID=UPI003D7BF7A2
MKAMSLQNLLYLLERARPWTEPGTEERQDLEEEGERRRRGKEDPGRRQNEIQPSALLAASPARAGPQHQDYEELEKQLKEVFKERSTILRQLTKTSRELDGIKVNLQSLKNDEKSAKTDVQKLLEIGQKQREQMKSLQEALQNQLKETSEKAEKQQATINFLKTEVERKSKMIRDLQNENKSLKNKLLSGNKLCGIRAEESKKIQAQLKELRYGKKDLLFKAQQLTDLEQKLAVARNALEKAALDRAQQSTPGSNESSQVVTTKEENLKIPECDSENVLQEDGTCLMKHKENTPRNDTAEPEPTPQKLQMPPCTECEVEKTQENQLTRFEGRVTREEKIL